MAHRCLAFLDTRVRAEPPVPFAGVWRKRLALSAAAASARLLRRGDFSEAKLRDAFYLRRPCDDPGPAGRLFLAWRQLSDRSTPLDDDAALHAADTLQLRADDALRAALAGAQDFAASAQGAPFAAARTASFVLTQRPDAIIFALWLADAVLATRLKWFLPLPLLASALLDPTLRVQGRRPHPCDQSNDWMLGCTLAYGRATETACDLFAKLSRHSQKLLAVAPRLRAKGAGAVIDLLHNEDAVPASARVATLSDRGLRRLFDRLQHLGAVQEFSERATFRLYGL